MRAQLSVLAATCCLAVVSAGALPEFLKACSASDPALSQCIERVIEAGGHSFAQGIPELGIASLDPVKLGTIDVANPALNLVFTDTVVTGLGGFKLNSYRINTAKGKATLDFVANVTLKAHYKMDGQILLLPIRGDGDARIKITNLNIVVKYDYSTVAGHWVVDGYKETYKMDHAHFKFSNLFNGNKQLGNTIMAVVNANWELIIRDIAPKTFTQIIKACVTEVSKLFAVIPADELLLP